MQPAVSLFEPRVRPDDPSVTWTLLMTFAGLAALLCLLVVPRICGPWCDHGELSDDELDQRRVDALHASIDRETCRREREPGEDLRDVWGHALRVYCAPGRYLWVVSDGRDGKPWSSDDKIGR